MQACNFYLFDRKVRSYIIVPNRGGFVTTICHRQDIEVCYNVYGNRVRATNNIKTEAIDSEISL